MTETEKAILDALNELDQKVQSMKTANPKPNLLPLFARLDGLAASLPKTANPELIHFLHRKSYDKARMLLMEAAGQIM